MNKLAYFVGKKVKLICNWKKKIVFYAWLICKIRIYPNELELSIIESVTAKAKTMHHKEKNGLLLKNR